MDVTIIDVVIIAIAMMLFLGALLLLRPQTSDRDVYQLRKMCKGAEQDRQQIASMLNTVEHGARDADYLTSQLKSRVEQINRENQISRTRAEDAERAIARAKEAEYELRDISTQLGQRIQHVQTYWDEQLSDTVETVKNIKKKLNLGLGSVDDSLLRLREQEQMSQSLTQKLLQHQKQQMSAQDENARLSAQVHKQLELMMTESNKTLDAIKQQQEQAEQAFKQFSTQIQEMEDHAQEQFTSAFQSADAARQELNANLDDSRKQLNSLREQQKSGEEMSRSITEKFDTVENLNVDKLSTTVSLTDEMCADLQGGLENARNLLQTLEKKTLQVLEEADDGTASNDEKKIESNETVIEENPRNLFSLRAYR